MSDLKGCHFYEYNPSLAWNVLFAVLMGLSLISHASQMVYLKAWWFGSMFVVGTICELIGYITRCLSHNDATNMSVYIAQATCLVFASVFLMADTYYLLAQLICVYGRPYSWISAKLCSRIFIVCDAISLILQGGGGGLMATDDGASYNLGRGLIISGLTFQLVTMVMFMVMFVSFLCKLHYSPVCVQVLRIETVSSIQVLSFDHHCSCVIDLCSFSIQISGVYPATRWTIARK